MFTPRVVALAFCGLMFTPTISEGQFPGAPGSPRPISIILSGGLTLPAGDLSNLHDAGFHYDVSLLVQLPGFPIALRPELSLSRFTLKDSFAGSTGGDDVTQMLAAMGNIELPLAGGLYLLAGGGLLKLTLADDAAGGDASASKIAVAAGAGFRFSLGPTRGFIEARMGTASYDQGTFGFTSARFIPVTFGLAF